MTPTGKPSPPAGDLPELCHSLMERAPVPMAELEGAGHTIRYVNPAFCRLVGKKWETLIGKPFAETVQEGDRCVAVLDRVYRTTEPETHTESEHPEPHPAYWSYAIWPVLDANQRSVGLMLQVTETTLFHQQTGAMNQELLLSSVRQHELTEIAEKLNDRLRAEIAKRERVAEALRSVMEFDEAVMMNMGEGLYTVDMEGLVTSINPVAEKLFGWSLEELRGKEMHGVTHYKHPDGRPFPAEECVGFQVLRQGKTLTDHEDLFIRKDGAFFPVVFSSSPLYEGDKITGLVVVFRDITERKRTEDQIQASLKEKEVLLREVHHRVKNNLQVIYSLLRLQSQSVTDPKALELFQDSQARVKAMALIHETLYQSQDISRIDMEGYISKLTGQLFKSYGISPNTIELRLNIAPLSLSIETAITCGLLINELVSNSLKYAFPNSRTGEVAIHLLPDSHGTHVLTVSDNGVGLPSSFEVGKAKSLGWQLVPMLVEQLAGTFELHRNAGTTVTLTFSELSYKGRV